MGQRTWCQVQAILAQALDHFIAQMHAGERGCGKAMLFHPVPHVPAAHGAGLGRTDAGMFFPHVKCRDAVDGCVHRVVQCRPEVAFLRKRCAQGHLARFKLLICRADHGDGIAVGLDQGCVHTVQLWVLNRKQHIRPGFLRVDDLGNFIDHALKVDAHFVADAIERRDRAVALLIPDPPELPGDQQGRRDQQAEPAGEESVELRFAHSEVP